MMDIIQVVLADDDPLVRRRLSRFLVQDEGVQVVGETTTGQEALNLLEQRQPDVLLVDLNLPGMDGLTLAQQVRQRGLRTRILLLRGAHDGFDIRALLAAGVEGALLKEEAPQVVLKTVYKAAHGQLGWNLWARKSLSARLTPYEQDVLRLVMLGSSNQFIAEQMDISSNEVEKYLYAIFMKVMLPEQSDHNDSLKELRS